MPSESNLAVETKALTRTFNDFVAVDKLDLSVERGSLYGFLGRNGAGKSTTIKMLTGILESTSGEIQILNTSMSDEELARSVRRHIGVVPENLALFELLKGPEYLTFVGRIYGMDGKIINDRVEELFSVLALTPDDKQLIMDYSHGMRKKLSLAAALLPNPEVLFLDEPFEGVDAVSSRVMRDILHRYVERECTVFITSHVLDIVENLCSHVGIIHEGRLVFEDAMSELGEKSLENVFLELVGSADNTTADLSWLGEK